MNKFKPQALHFIKIKYWNPSGSGNRPTLIPALRKIAILGVKQACGNDKMASVYLYLEEGNKLTRLGS